MMPQLILYIHNIEKFRKEQQQSEIFKSCSTYLFMVFNHLLVAQNYLLVSQMTTCKKPYETLFPTCFVCFTVRFNHFKSKKLAYHRFAPFLFKRLNISEIRAGGNFKNNSNPYQAVLNHPFY
jgi:hypothetical protein